MSELTARLSQDIEPVLEPERCDCGVALDPDDGDLCPDCTDHGTCELCGGELYLLGILGRRIHYTCRDCGMQSSKVKPEVCPDCGTATMAIHQDGSKTCGHCYMKRAYDLGVLKGPRPHEYR